MATSFSSDLTNLTGESFPTNSTARPEKISPSKVVEYLQVVFSVLLMIIIIIGNLLVMAAYKLNHRLRTSTYTLLVSLAFCDFLVGSISVPMWIYVSFNEWKNIHRIVNIFFQGLDYLTALSSALHLTIICLERLLAISKPYFHQTLTRSRYYIAIGLVWLVALLGSAMVVITSNLKTKNYKFYILVLVILGFIYPMIVISFVNIYIFKVAKKLIQDEHSGSTGSRHERRKKVQKERRTAKTLVIITALFFIELLPTYTIALVGGFCTDKCLTKMKWKDILRLMTFAKWMQYSNSGVNPFIYAFRDAEMRRTFHRISSRLMLLRPLTAVANFGSQSENQSRNNFRAAMTNTLK